MLNKYVISELISLIDSEFKNFKTPEGVLNKEQFDYVTQLDLCLQKKISIFINNFFPGHFIIGEEGIPLTLDLTAPTWVIDPLDGTSNYLFGIPFIAVSIAYVSCGEVKSAFVYDLIHKDVYWANLGRGAFLNDSKLSSNDGRRSSDFIGLSSGFIDISVCKNPGILAQLRESGKFRIVGSQALHLCYVASGKFRSTINFEAKIWDDIAGALILEESGKKYEFFDGSGSADLARLAPLGNLFSVAGESNDNVFELIDKLR